MAKKKAGSKSGTRTKARLGRPPASSSAETRGRIIDVARRCFAEMGYEATTNRALASEAGITTGAIYHYFESKLEIFGAVYDEVQERVYRRFRQAEAEADTFVEKFEVVLETAHELNKEDPSLARFLGSARIDHERIPELREAFASGEPRRESFFRAIVARGVETGEIDPADDQKVLALIRTITVGLTDALSSDVEAHRNATDAIKALLEGKLIRHVPDDRR